MDDKRKSSYYFIPEAFSELGLRGTSAKCYIHPLLRIENQASNLDGLPLRRIFRARGVWEGSVRCQPCPVCCGIEALDQNDLVRRLVGQVVPAELRVVLDGERLTLAVGVNEFHRDEVVVDVQGSPVADSERFVGDGVSDRAPNVDDANTRLEKTIRFVSQVVTHTLLARSERLVDMDLLLKRS